VIEVDRLSKTFHVHKKEPGLLGSLRSLFLRKKVAKHAVREVSFGVKQGEIVGLVGANGAGKTTLVKMLAGIIHPSAGDAHVLDYQPWRRDDRYRQQIALIMGQKAQLWWDLPAGDCFLLLKEIYRIPDDVYRQRLDHLSEVLGVRDEIDVQIRRLSLGERMKMELISALLHAPKVVFLDEPTIGLDLTTQRAIRDFLLWYREEHSPAMIVTSHYMDDIESLCKRIIILREGEIIYDGLLTRVVETYADHKIVKAHLRDGGNVATVPEVAALGEFEVLEDLELRLRVPREDVAKAAAAVLKHYPVVDLTIEEVDIAAIIEGIISSRSGGATP
jgi:ABC-2 type transport system ATP-binding protein